MKFKRHNKIINLISNNDVQTQEELTDYLKQEGFSVTQATVSRDIKELGLVKALGKDGEYKYAQPNVGNMQMSQITTFSEAVISIDYAIHTVVVKTFTGAAQAVAASIDALHSSQMLGSIAGDDTIIIITASEETASRFTERLKQMFKLR